MLRLCLQWTATAVLNFCKEGTEAAIGRGVEFCCTEPGRLTSDYMLS